MIGEFLRTLVALVVSLVVADVVGVIGTSFFDVMPIRGSDSAALPYAIWFVLGIFAGLIALSWAGSWISPKGENWMEAPGAASIATRVVLFSAAIMVAFLAFYWWLEWSRGVDSGYYVPDSMPHTLTYFIAALAAMAFFRYALKPKPAA
jgi:hypothetical protein